MTKLRRIILSLVLILLVLLGIGSATLYTQTYRPVLKAQAFAQKAEQFNDYFYFKAVGKEQATLVFYQGALVEETSYAGLAAKLTNHGISTYILKTPLNLPVLASKKADQVINTKHLKNVYLAGHSLGGVVASMNAKDKAVKGLILLASYPSQKTNLAQSKLRVLSITASQDKVLKWNNYKTAKKRLPKSTDYQTIKGGNHGQFGNYGHQKGDGTATITQDEQERQVVQLMSSFITNQ